MLKRCLLVAPKPSSLNFYGMRSQGTMWVLDTTIALQHLIFEGTLDRFPGLKVLAAHGGGYLGSSRRAPTTPASSRRRIATRTSS
jgi:hypothetical protein